MPMLFWLISKEVYKYFDRLTFKHSQSLTPPSLPILFQLISKDFNDTLSAVKKRNRGSYRSAHVLMNLLNELGKSDKMRGLPSILSLFHNEFNKFNNTRARMLDSIYQMT